MFTGVGVCADVEILVVTWVLMFPRNGVFESPVMWKQKSVGTPVRMVKLFRRAWLFFQFKPRKKLERALI